MTNNEGAVTPAVAPFVPDERGYPTEASVRTALDDCQIGVLADTEAFYRGKRDRLAPLMAQNCLAKHLGKDYPKAFTAISIAAVTAALESDEP